MAFLRCKHLLYRGFLHPSLKRAAYGDLIHQPMQLVRLSPIGLHMEMAPVKGSVLCRPFHPLLIISTQVRRFRSRRAY